MTQEDSHVCKPLYDAILEGDAPGATAAISEALDAGANPQELLDGTMIPAMDEVGRLFEANEYFVPELLVAARAMKAALTKVQPILTASGAKPHGRVAIGTVKGDLHDIGKNLVGAMLEGGGFEVVDLGVDVSPETFIETVRKEGVQILAMSALLTTTMPSIKTTIEALREAGVRDQLKVMIGGAPVTQEFANEIGADAYGHSAASAVVLARQLIGAK